MVNHQNEMRKLFFTLVFFYGVGLSTYFAHWGIRDMAALEKAVSVGAHHEEMRHRMNVSAEGNWFLLSNLIAVTGALGVVGGSKKNA
jgi:hypothetical protein